MEELRYSHTRRRTPNEERASPSRLTGRLTSSSSLARPIAVYLLCTFSATVLSVLLGLAGGREASGALGLACSPRIAVSVRSWNSELREDSIAAFFDSNVCK